MKTTKILYWIVTGLFAAFMIFSAIPDIMSNGDAVKMMNGQLGYPLYIIPFLGWAKVLGSIAILVPGFPRIKEWAYAGLTFDLVGATYSGMAINNPPGMWMWMFIFFIPLIASYYLYHKKLKNEQSAIRN